MTQEIPLPIEKMLAISTAHVSEVTSWYLNQWSVSPQVPPVICYPKGEYGWFVYVSLELVKTDDTFPSDLLVCIKYARSLNCDWIAFDRDATTIAALPVYDW